MRGQDSHETMQVRPFSGHTASARRSLTARRSRAADRSGERHDLVDLSVGQTAQGALRRQSSRRVHRYEGQAAWKLAVIL